MTENEKIKIAIAGLGPVGIILAIFFKEAGCEVALFDRNRIKINQIKNEGLKLTGTFNKQAHFEHICTNLNEVKEFNPDYFIFALKTYQLAGMVKKVQEVFSNSAKTPGMISAQNGIDTEKILSDVFGEKNTFRMVINFAGNLQTQNHVKTTFFNPPNYIASVDDSRTDDAKSLADLLTKVQLDTTEINSYELIRRTWEKTILNASLSAICGVGKMSMKDAMDMPDTVEIIEQIIEESVQVAAAEKIFFEDDFIRKCMRYLRKAGNHFPSMAVDIVNNRETEIDYLNGKIVEYGKKHYIRASLNLVFTNTVKAMTQKSMLSQLSTQGLIDGNEDIQDLSKFGIYQDIEVMGDCFLGIDLGSAYTKFTVIDSNENIVFQSAIKTLNRDRISVKHIMDAINDEFPVKYRCATGYGRKTFSDAEIAKTEINCAAEGVSKYFKGAKNIIDIGGEDIKIIKCDESNNVDNFYMNDKCAAGTGSFLSEIGEKAGINIQEMSTLASKSNYDKELNSFCTVFAKTEIMKWMFEGMAIEDVAKGIYLSIANRVAKLRVDPGFQIFMIGGVVAHHDYFKKILSDKFQQEVKIVEGPQFIVSLGAAMVAKQTYNSILQNKNRTNSKENEAQGNYRAV